MEFPSNPLLPLIPRQVLCILPSDYCLNPSTSLQLRHLPSGPASITSHLDYFLNSKLSSMYALHKQ